jgi:RNA polymerase sigma-70 factor (ECF subfamily)
MQLLKDGNSQAFEVLYERYFDKLTWFAQQFTFELHAAEDIVQEVFMKLIERPQLFDTQKTFSTWIFTLVANRGRNYIRDHKNRQELLHKNSHEAITHIQPIFDYQKLTAELAKALQAMPEKDRSIFHLRFEQELPIKEIASITQIPEGTVKSSIFYLLKKLSQKLKDF